MHENCPDGLHAVLRKGLRARLACLLEELGRIDWADESRPEAALGELDVLLAHLETHSCCEDAVLGVLERAGLAADGSLRAIAADHACLREACYALTTDIARLRAAAGPVRVAVGVRLQHRLAVFLSRYIEHLLCEDIEGSALLRAHLGMTAWQRLEVESLTGLPGEVQSRLLAWALPAASLREWRGLEQALDGGARPRAGPDAESLAGPGSRAGNRNVSYSPNCW